MSDPTRNLWRTIAIGACSCVVGFGIAGVAWGARSATIDEHTKKIEKMEEDAAKDHDILLRIDTRVEALIKERDLMASLLAEMKMLRDEISRTRSAPK